jgi:hypothetical protein
MKRDEESVYRYIGKYPPPPREWDNSNFRCYSIRGTEKRKREKAKKWGEEKR